FRRVLFRSRKTTREELPGEFEVEVIFTPATLPANALMALVFLPSVNSSAFNVGAEYPKDLFSLLIAFAVTTTSSRDISSATKLTLIVVLLLTLTLCEA